MSKKTNDGLEESVKRELSKWENDLRAILDERSSKFELGDWYPSLKIFLEYNVLIETPSKLGKMVKIGTPEFGENTTFNPISLFVFSQDVKFKNFLKMIFRSIKAFLFGKNRVKNECCRVGLPGTEPGNVTLQNYLKQDIYNSINVLKYMEELYSGVMVLKPQVKEEIEFFLKPFEVNVVHLTMPSGEIKISKIFDKELCNRYESKDFQVVTHHVVYGINEQGEYKVLFVFLQKQK